LSQNQSSKKTSAASSSPDINVTPLIDVLLVLLIIFMVISPRREAQLPVRAPDKSPAQIDPGPSAVLMLTVSSEFQLALNTKPLMHSELRLVLKDLMEQREAEARALFIKAPPLVPYESVISLVDVAKGSGVMTIGLLAD
jgi:biopolymer transport protein ExbD